MMKLMGLHRERAVMSNVNVSHIQQQSHRLHPKPLNLEAWSELSRNQIILCG